MVRCEKTASRSLVYGSSAIIAVWTTAKTSPASEPIMVKPRMRSSLALTTAFMKPVFSSVASVRRTWLIGSFPMRAGTPWRRAAQARFSEPMTTGISK